MTNCTHQGFGIYPLRAVWLRGRFVMACRNCGTIPTKKNYEARKDLN